MNSIKFNYLYRDAGNYKNYGFQVFKNPDNLPVSMIENKLAATFFEGLLFIANQIDLPELFHEDYPTIDDVSFHEYAGLEIIQDTGDVSGRTIKEFVERIEQESVLGWRFFDPHERSYRF